HESDILAPIFLWPVNVRVDYRRQGRVFISRADKIPPQFNRVMSAWVQRQLGVQLHTTGSSELSEFDIDSIERELRQLEYQFHTRPPELDCGQLLHAVPSTKALTPKESPRFYNSSVIGYFRWQNEAILADLEALRDQRECDGLAGDLLCGDDLPTPAD